MTREEAKGFVQGKLDCMDRCDVFDCKGTDECDNCVYCYSQGNFGEQKKAFVMAIEALEKQIPKKIVKVKILNTSFCKAGTRYKCPSCGEKMHADWKFCFECGQALDWTEEGET